MTPSLPLTRMQLLDIFRSKSGAHKNLQAPWSQDGYVYATNGAWAVRLPQCAELDSVAARPKDAPSGMPEVFSKAPWSSLRPMPAVTAPPPCAECGAKGVTLVRPCPECEGEGEFNHGSHWYKCKECRGDGGVRAETPCPNCEGTGYDTFARSRPPMPTGNTSANHYYLWRISQLPGVLLGHNKDPLGLIAFRFDGGEGVLMPRLDGTKAP